MNNQNLMMARDKAQQGQLPEYVKKPVDAAVIGMSPRNDRTSMVRRDVAAGGMQPREKMIINPGDAQAAEAPAPVKQVSGMKPVQPAKVGATKDELAARTGMLKDRAAAAVKDAGAKAGMQQAGRPPSQAPSQAPAKPAAKPQQAAQPAPQLRVTVPKAIRQADTPDGLCQAYIKAFKDSLGLDLSPAIVFENMRRMCEPDVKDPTKTLFFLENTYRVSTILYLAGNLPILVVTSILAEKNRKNILKYVTLEVENGSKPYDQLRELRVKRWARKYENMSVNDAMTVTPGATMLTPELAFEAKAAFLGMGTKLKSSTMR